MHCICILIMSTLVSIKLYYDEYEYEFGDGFYPQFGKLDGGSSSETNEKGVQVIFQFIQERNAWKQVYNTDQKAITGLDPPYGEELVNVLNIEYGAATATTATATSIENMWNKKVYQTKIKKD